MAQLGYVFWGLRNGFTNNLLSVGIEAEIYNRFTDEMRQVCQGTVDNFYSIEKIPKYTLISLFNPNTKDNFGRRGYTALSLCIPDGHDLQGNVTQCLDALMNGYLAKQGNAMVNMVNAVDLQHNLDEIALVKSHPELVHVRNKIGLTYFKDSETLNVLFTKPRIYHFSKVFFAKTENKSLEKYSNIQLVNTFSKPLFLTLTNFDPKRHKATINSKPVTNYRTAISQGDRISVEELATGRKYHHEVSNIDVLLSALEMFPSIPTRREMNTSKEQGSQQHNSGKTIFIISFSLLLLGIGAYFLYPIVFNTGAQNAGNSPSKNALKENNQDTVHTELPIQFHINYDYKTLTWTNAPHDSINEIVIMWDGEKVATLNAKNRYKKNIDLNHTNNVNVNYTIGKRSLTATPKLDYALPHTHRIQNKEGLSKIAEKYNIEKDSLLAWNNIKNENKIKAGNELNLRAVKKSNKKSTIPLEEKNKNNSSAKIKIIENEEYYNTAISQLLQNDIDILVNDLKKLTNLSPKELEKRQDYIEEFERYEKWDLLGLDLEKLKRKYEDADKLKIDISKFIEDVKTKYAEHNL